MPELPEVETTVRELKKKIIGKKIIDVWTDTPKIIKRPSFSLLKKNIKQRKIRNITRKGKNIIIELDKNRAVLIHQKMTGHLLFGEWKKEKESWIPFKNKHLEDPMNRFIHLFFFLENGGMVALSDLRKFAKVIFGTKEEINSLEELKKLGPDALAVNFRDFNKKIKSKKGKIKQVLMNQEIISGIGNIYSDEILFDAKINPFKNSVELEEDELRRIFNSTKKILKLGVKLKGESFSDYRIPSGKKGNFDSKRKVYRREGERCPKCNGKIKREKIGGRSAHFCPTCQKI
ncbi:MAG: DNA-formamidopyrimidine glycosylase [Candidatus Pacebacteria bacterium]|nr:DNA-formamidopyrimidine glycosylase [Candidatus Paceibacterota bacterium]